MLKILIADDSALLRTQLRLELTQRKGWSVCGEAVDGREAVLMAAELHPDLIVMDFAMPFLTGIQASEKILKTAPEIPIILYTVHRVSQLEREADRVGIRKVVSKGDDLTSVIAEIEKSRPLKKSTGHATQET